MFREKIEDSGVNWRSSWQGSTTGPLPTKWGVTGFPTKYIIDAKGVIRYMDGDLWGENAIETAVETLLAEMKAEKK